MIAMRLNRLQKPLTEYTDEELLEERKKLFEVLNAMVGQFYPPLVRADITEINDEVAKRKHGRPS